MALLETIIFLSGAVLALNAVIGRRRPNLSVLMLFPAGMALWAAFQLRWSWTVVRSDTTEALLYWLAATCLVWLAHEACSIRGERQQFLKAALISGFLICLLGLIQLFTSDGSVFWLFKSGYNNLVIGPFVSPNNYASFVELLLPLALMPAFSGRQQAKGYMVVAAALVASVIASGSRAGAAIVIAESALAFLLLRRADRQAIGRRWVEFAVVAVVFTVIAGYQYLWDRLSGQEESYTVRREFLQSSLAMARDQPLHGFGLGSWPSAYKPYALIDTGRVANHAHNEWAQWAAEGGLPAFALMFGLLLLCAPSAVRTVWGLGVLAVFVHSLVDYPFMRLGLAAWTFALIGALSGYRQERQSIEDARFRAPKLLGQVFAAVMLLVFALGTYESVRIGWADTLYRRGTPGSEAAAIALWPDQADYHLELAQIKPEDAVKQLRQAVSLNPFLTSARIALASQMEAAGDTTSAEAALLEASRRDKQYAPAWALANFYFRAGRPEQFWHWARIATRISYGGLSPLFDLCFALTDDPSIVLQRVVVPRALVQYEYLAYLLAKGRVADARPVALLLAANAKEDGREPLLKYIDRALDIGQFEPAQEVWDRLASRHLVPYETAHPGVLINGDFGQPILNHAFDWRKPVNNCAVTAQTVSAGPALEAFFSGKEPENCDFLGHFVVLDKGTEYVLRYEYRTSDLPAQTGIHWSVIPRGNPRVVRVRRVVQRRMAFSSVRQRSPANFGLSTRFRNAANRGHNSPAESQT